MFGVERGSAAWRVLVAVGAVVAVVAVTAPAFVLDPIPARLFTRFVALAVVLLGLQLVVGVSGQLSLCHGVFVAVGSYTAAITNTTWGWPIWAGLLLSPVTAFVAGSLVGVLALRIRATYLGPVTLGVAVAFPMLLKRFSWLTGGATGLPLLREMSPPAGLALHQWNHLVSVAVAFVAFVLMRNLQQSAIGLSVRAVAGNAFSASTSGVDVRATRVRAFGTGAAFGGLGGALLVIDTPIVGADSYDLFRSLGYYAAAVVGGVGSMLGAVLGGLLLIGVPWVLDTLGSRVGPNLVFGALLVVSVALSPGGLAVAVQRGMGLVVTVRERIPGRPAKSGDEPT